MFILTVLSLFLFLFLQPLAFRSADISSVTIKATVLQFGTNIALVSEDVDRHFLFTPMYLAMLPPEAAKGFRSSIHILGNRLSYMHVWWLIS